LLGDLNFAPPVEEECLGLFLECKETEAKGASFAISSGANRGRGLDNWLGSKLKSLLKLDDGLGGTNGTTFDNSLTLDLSPPLAFALLTLPSRNG